MIRFPAEWEKQSAVLIAWPHQKGDFTHILESVESTYVEIAKAITGFQPLVIVCHDDSHEMRIRKLIGDDHNVFFIQATVNDTWVRDTVFLTVENEGNPLLLNFRFNGWGNKYPHHEDDALNHKLLPHKPFKGAAHQDIDFILEGGSIESDGLGTLLTTRQCLLNPNRNGSLNQDAIEQELREKLGVTRILWVNQENLAGDDTDAHIDTLARLCSETTIAYTSCEDDSDPHFRSLKNMEAQLKTFHSSKNEPYTLVALPLPRPIHDDQGIRLPANYSNFLILNGAILAPVYSDPMDNVALERLAKCFPDRTIKPIDCRPLVHQYGSLHCMTMQFPENALLM